MPVQRVRKPHLGTLVSGGYKNHPRYRGVVGHWIMGEGSGAHDSTTRDVSGNNNHGLLQDDLVDPPIWVPGQFGKALEFDGNRSRLEIPSSPVLENFTQLSLIAWVNPTGNGQASSSRIVTKAQSGTSDDYTLQYDSSNFLGGRVNTTSIFTINADVATAPNTGWHHLVMTWDGSNLNLFVNGFIATTPVSATGTLDDSNDTLNFGKHPNTNTARQFEGIIDEVRVYNRVLTIGEIRSLYKEPFLEFNNIKAYGTRNLEINIFEEDVTPPPVDEVTRLFAWEGFG